MTDDPQYRERLARVAWAVVHDETETWHDALAIEKQPYMMEIDAILAEQAAIEREQSNVVRVPVEGKVNEQDKPA